MRISDWSSDVCSSDLGSRRGLKQRSANPRALPTCRRIPWEPARIETVSSRAKTSAATVAGSHGSRRGLNRARARSPATRHTDRKSVVSGNGGSESGDTGGRRSTKKKKEEKKKE